MSNQTRAQKSEGSGKPSGDNGSQDEQKKSIHQQKKNNPKQKWSKSNNFYLNPPTNFNPGNIAQWKRKITADLKEKAHKLACFTDTGKKYVRPLPKLIPDDENILLKEKNKFVDDDKKCLNHDGSDSDESSSDSDSSDSEGSLKNSDVELSEQSVEYENNLMKADRETKKLLFLEDMKQYRKDVRKDEEVYEELYIFIWNRCSLEAQQLLEQQKGFNKISRNCDTIKLWKLINKTFLRMDNYNDERLAAFNYNRYFNDKLVQGPSETVASFKENFESAVRTFDEYNITKPSSDQLALIFIDKLDERRFSQFKRDFMKDLKKGIKMPPNDIQDAMDEINKYRFNNPNQGEFSGYRNTKNQHTKNSAVFTTKASSQSDNKQSENDDNSHSVEASNRSNNGEKKRDVVCYGCKQKGHIRPHCPNKKVPQQKASNYALTTKSSSFFCVMTSESTISISSDTIDDTIHSKILVTKESDNSGRILLDSCAQASVVNDKRLLTDIKESNIQLVIEGVNGNEGSGPSTRTVGNLGSLGTVFLCEDIRVSVLSFADIRARCKVIYDDERDMFIVTCQDGTKYQFDQWNKLYATKFSKPVQAVETTTALTAPTTVKAREQMYHKHEVKRAKEAVRICRCLGYEGYDGLLHVIRTGAFINLGLTPQDVRRANELYGPLIAHIKGTSTRCKVPFRNAIKVERSMDILQKLYVDIMYIDLVPFLIGVSKPMNLITVEMLPNKGSKAISKAVHNFIDTYRSYSYEVDSIISDGEPNLAGAFSRIPGIRFDPVGTGVHVSIIESKIRRIKEKVRSVLHSLPYNWPKRWIQWIVYFAVRARNRIPVRGSGTTLSPAEQLTGIKCDAKTDLRIAFGDYAQIKEMETDNSMKERTKGCVALLPTANLEGSVKFMDLTTLEPITRTAWTPLPITQETIEYINSLCERDDGEAVPRDPTVLYRQGQIMPDDDVIDDRIADRLVGEDYNGEYEEDFGQSSDIDEDASDDNVSNDSDDDDDNNDGDDERVHNSNEQEQPDIPKTTRSGRVVKQNEIFTSGDYEAKMPKVRSKTSVAITEKHYIFNLSVKQGIELYGDEARDSINKELKSLLDLNVWDPIEPSIETKDLKDHLIPSKLFLKEKFKPNGEFDRLKSRLVAGGHMQDRELYPDKSSPTPSINSIFIIATLAAFRRCTVVTLDIGNAYVNAKLTGPPVYMRVDRDLASRICSIDSGFSPFVRSNGEIVVQLKKALYGCIQSGKLWFNHISNLLLEIGFTQNPCDECVFNCGDGDGMSVEDLVEYVQSKFEKTTVHRGNVHSYVGMTFTFDTEQKSVKITMDGYIAALMREYSIEKKCDDTGKQ